VTIQAMVRNLGDLAVADVKVRLIEGGAVLQEQAVILGGQGMATVTFIYDTAGRSGAHTVQIAVDPENQVAEQSEENNRAEKTFGVQNANLWVSEQYISPNGDGVQDDTRLFFRLDAPQTVQVVVVNEDGEIVRTFSELHLENADGAEVFWDGLDELGRVVDDGEYKLQIQAAGGILGELTVVVDNNRSPITKAIELGQLINFTSDSKHSNWDLVGWLSDESGILFRGYPYAVGYDPARPYGLYKVDPGGKNTTLLTPGDWFYDYRSYLYAELSINSEIALVAVRYGMGASLYVNNNEEWVSIDSATIKPRWSSDGNKIAYQKNRQLRENVIASTDCGLGGRVHPEIAWAKLESLARGAEFATQQLWR
jgi:flagellar hook assembly protein FlgD